MNVNLHSITGPDSEKKNYNSLVCRGCETLFLKINHEFVASQWNTIGYWYVNIIRKNPVEMRHQWDGSFSLFPIL